MFNYYYLVLIDLFNINHVFADNEVFISIDISTNYSIQLYSFICPLLNGSEYFSISLKILLKIGDLFTCS